MALRLRDVGLVILSLAMVLMAGIAIGRNVERMAVLAAEATPPIVRIGPNAARARIRPRCPRPPRADLRPQKQRAPRCRGARGCDGD